MAEGWLTRSHPLKLFIIMSVGIAKLAYCLYFRLTNSRIILELNFFVFLEIAPHNALHYFVKQLFVNVTGGNVITDVFGFSKKCLGD